MRRSGQTTRLIDQAVQTLFTTGIVKFEDHHFGESDKAHKRASEFGFHILLKRLDREHGGIDGFLVDRKNFIVKIKTK